MKGKIIVFEGSDGAGKTTQVELLKGYCKSQKFPIKSISFPQYTNTFFGKTIARILRGEIAPLKQINPYLISIVYAMDRATVRNKLYKWINDGKIIILHRYVTSNMAHQAGRLPKKEQRKFLKWLDELEYKVNNVPREDIVIYLYIPYQISLKLLKERTRGKYTKGKQDITENNAEYLRKGEETYLMLAKKFQHWIIIKCIDKEGNLKSREEIHGEVKKVLAERRVLVVK